MTIYQPRQEVAALQLAQLGNNCWAIGVQWPAKAYLRNDCRLGITQGGKEAGEDDETALRRELEEELGQTEGIAVLGRLCQVTYQPQHSPQPKAFSLMLVTTSARVYPRDGVVADFRWCAGQEELFWAMAHMSSQKAKLISRGLALASPLLPGIPLTTLFGDLMSL